MKKLLLSIVFIFFISLAFSQSSVRIDTLVVSKCKKEVYSNKIQSIIEHIPNAKQSAYIGNQHIQLVKGLIDNLNKTFKTKAFSKVSIAFISYYEKPNIGGEEYISVQQWNFQNYRDCNKAFDLLKTINQVSLKHFLFFPHMVWVKKENSLFLVDTTLATKNPHINEVVKLIKEEVNSDSIIVLN